MAAGVGDERVGQPLRRCQRDHEWQGDLMLRSRRVALFARAFGLSTRESELLGHLVTGTDTRELARRMFLSEHTVQDHLKSIFAKTAARNRRILGLSVTALLPFPGRAWAVSGPM